MSYMLAKKTISRKKLNKLPEEALRLINMGQYSLYEVSVENRPDVVYALRTEATKIYLLNKNGKPIKELSSVNFSIKSKVVIEDVALNWAPELMEFYKKTRFGKARLSP